MKTLAWILALALMGLAPYFLPETVLDLLTYGILIGAGVALVLLKNT